MRFDQLFLHMLYVLFKIWHSLVRIVKTVHYVFFLQMHTIIVVLLLPSFFLVNAVAAAADLPVSYLYVWLSECHRKLLSVNGVRFNIHTIIVIIIVVYIV